jgi:hypothetical protein
LKKVFFPQKLLKINIFSHFILHSYAKKAYTPCGGGLSGFCCLRAAGGFRRRYHHFPAAGATGQQQQPRENAAKGQWQQKGQLPQQSIFFACIT